MQHDPFALIGRVIADKYRVDELLGEGGYGVVYGGQHLLIDEEVAIKCMKPLGATAEDQARATDLFLREARVLFNLAHPGIVRMYDVGTLHDEGRNVPYVVLERLRGASLEDLIRVGRPAFERAEIEWTFERILEALAFAHEHGVVHRDLKPSNLMLVSPGQAASGDDTATRSSKQTRMKVLDFGVARWADEQRPPSGLTGFTPAYASPEQWDDDLSLVGPPSDVFALGVILAEMCTMSPVFGHSSPARILRAVIDPTRRIEVLRLRPDLPAGLDALLARATAMNPDERHSTARALLEDFRTVFALTTPLAAGRPPDIPAPRGGEPSRGASQVTPLALAPTERNPVTASTPRTDSTRLETLEAAPSHVLTTGRPSWAAAVVLASAVAGGAAVWWLRAPAAPVAQAAVSVTVPTPSAQASPPFPGARVAPRAFTAGDFYTARQLDDALEKQTSTLDDCYQRALASDERLSGRTIWLLALKPSGNVFGVAALDDADWVGDAARSEGLRVCTRSALEQWTFPAHVKPDLVGVVLVLHHQPVRGELAAVLRERVGHFTSRFHNTKTGESYNPTPAVLVRDHDVVSLEYPDGALACMMYPLDKSLSCRWIQTDYRGGAALVPKRAGYAGTWGYHPSDSDGGSWTLEPTAANTAGTQR